MMTVSRNQKLDSHLIVQVEPAGKYLKVIGHSGIGARLPLYGPAEVMGGAVQQIRLTGAQLQTLPRADRYAVLRQCRHLLQPGGQLQLEVGSRRHQYPSQELEQAAWSCGFESWVHYFSGKAGLSKPSRIAIEQPLVSILVPAYKSAHLREALQSALDQTYASCELIVCDDGPDDEVEAIVADFNGKSRSTDAGPPVRYVRNPKNLGGQQNYLQCFELARGDYIKFLNDDDVLDPRCVEVMAGCLRDHPAVTLVTSYRQLIDETGEALPDQVFNAPLATRNTVIDGRHLATRLLVEKINRIGEPTTAMFRKQDMLESRPHLFSFQGTPARRNGDTFIWASLLSRGDAVYLPAPLSRFRQHASQVQRDPDFVADAVQVWVELAAAAKAAGLVHRSFGGGQSELPLQDGDGQSDTTAATETDPQVLALLQQNDLPGAAARLRGRLYADQTNRRLRSDLGSVTWECGNHESGLVEILLALSGGHDEVTLLNFRDMLKFLGRDTEAELLADSLSGAVV